MVQGSTHDTMPTQLRDFQNSSSMESANDRIAALRNQFMNFRKQSEVMNVQPLEVNYNKSDANLTEDKADKNSPMDIAEDNKTNEIRSLLQDNFKEAITIGNYPRSSRA